MRKFCDRIIKLGLFFCVMNVFANDDLTMFCKSSPESGALLEIDLVSKTITSINVHDMREQKIIPITSFTSDKIVSDIPGDDELYGQMRRVLTLDLDGPTMTSEVILPEEDQILLTREIPCTFIKNM